MDTVEGSRADSACILTLLHRPSRLQLYLPLPAKDAACVAAALGGVRSVLGPDGMGRVFRAVLTDNGAEFSDEGAIADLVGEGPGETRLFYCDPRRSDQKGDLCQDFGHASSRNQAAIGMASGLGSVLSKKAAMASAGTL